MPETMSTKWTPRNKWRVFDLFASRTKRATAPAPSAAPAAAAGITEEQLLELRNWEQYLGSVLTVLERYPDAITAVREALRREREAARERDESSRDEKPGERRR